MNCKNDKQFLEQIKRMASAKTYESIIDERAALDKQKLLEFAGRMKAMTIPELHRPELRVALADRVQILAAWCVETAGTI